MYCEVVVEKTSRNIDMKFTYKVKKNQINKISPGMRVTVDFNGRETEAVVMNVRKKVDISDDNLKYISSLSDKYPVISKESLELIEWMREYYVCRYIDAIKLFYPPIGSHDIQFYFGFKNYKGNLSKNQKYILNLLKDEDKSFDYLFNHFEGFEFTQDLYKLLNQNNLEGYIKKLSGKVKKRKTVELINKKDTIEEYNIRPNANKQIDIINLLLENEKKELELKELLKKSNSTLSSIKSLVKKEILNIREVEEKFVISKQNDILDNPILLNEEQINALKSISDYKFNLIHGITGSGKTEVYINIIKNYIKVNKKVIMLFPEISLTNHMINRFKARFGNRIAVIHSRMNARRKSEEWLKINNGLADLIIGARSAIFTPVKNLGAIIIDEEHDDSYNSSITPKYKTIEIAEKISKINDCKLILGSATPAVSTFYKTLKNKYNLIEIKNRVNNYKLPKIEVIDMKNELDEGNKSIFSRKLYKEIVERLKKKEQVILFLNKRGYSSFVSCRKCGYVVKCDSCDVSMTYHSSVNRLICHYCGKSKALPKVCPECKSKYIKTFGIGTQKIENIARKMFPDKNIDRMDFDTVTKKGAQEKIYKRLSSGETDILVGTQMLAKGIHFPNVTLVGIISADTTINLPFFTASEKSFQLITQVSGRAGRGEKEGNVILQTYEPEHYSVQCAINYNYRSFLKQELMLRKEFKYPPYIRILYINTKSKNEKSLNEFNYEKYTELTKKLYKYIKNGHIKVYKPVPKGIYKVNNEYQIDTIIKTKLDKDIEIKEILREVYFNKSYNNIYITLEIDPNSIT